MKCYRHPREDALYECSMCGKPICGECMVFTEDTEHITCPVCNMSTARTATFGDAVEDLEGFAASVAEAQRHRPRWRDRFDVRVNLPLFMLVMVLMGLNLLVMDQLKRADMPVTYSDPRLLENNSPAPQFTYIFSQITRYRQDKGRYPRSLDDLRGEYMDGEPLIMKTQETFQYAVDPREGFVLAVPRAERFRFPRLYATGDGEIHLE